MKSVIFWLTLALAPGWAADKADLSRLVVVGDSLSAGYQNSSLLASQQVHGYAALVAAQAGVDLSLPLIAEPGIPSVLTLISPGPPPVVAPAPGTSPGRMDPLLQTMDLAVPGQNLQDGLTKRPDSPLDSLTDLVLGLPGLLSGIARSQVEWAENLSPTTVICWLGNMDALGSATNGTDQELTPVADFAASYRSLLDRLAATGARIVVGNIPDVTSTAYFTPAEAVAALLGLPLETIGPLFGIAPGDYVTPDAFPLIVNGTPSPLPANVVLTTAEVDAIRSAIDAYNAVIAAEAQAHGAALADIHALTRRVKEHGYEVLGHRLTTDFLGGMFSLDGIHPTNTGYAVIANEFIQELNTQFAAGIPPVAVEKVFAEDPLAPLAGSQGAHAHVSPDAVRSLRTTFAH